jgi:hypothetical protein
MVLYAAKDVAVRTEIEKANYEMVLKNLKEIAKNAQVLVGDDGEVDELEKTQVLSTGGFSGTDRLIEDMERAF